ncbi:MAG: hypothetical protein QOE08_522 [Thermoleophilaceae bacterium]|nr:hypothetical protein [Thermoleophilaceae bacterium]
MAAAATKPKLRARTTQQAHRAAHAQPARRTRQTPAPARRKSGAAPRRAPARRAAPQRVEAGVRIERLLEGRAGQLLDSLLRGRAWVVIVGALLVGIVFLNVSVLQLNRGIASTTAKSAELERANSGMRARVAMLGSSDRIQTAAAMRGFIMPAPGQVKYLRARPADAQLAAKRLSTQSTLASSSSSAATTPVASTTPAQTQTAAQPQAQPAQPVAQTTAQPAAPAAVATAPTP